MTRFLFALALSILTLWGALLGSSPAAAAGTVISEVECGIILPGILADGQVLSTIGVLSLSPNGIATMTCEGFLAEPTGQLTVFTDIDCSLGDGGQVAESLTIVRPTGKVTLTCHNNPGTEPFVPDPGD